MRTPSPLAQSVLARLARTAKELGVDPNFILSRYAAERLLHRLSRSQHASRFVLKGAMMLIVWVGDLVRPTRDIDLLGLGDLRDDEVLAIFKQIVTTEVEPDGVTFDPDSITASRIREEDVYGGRRLMLSGHLGAARLRVQIDIGIGDAVYPEPVLIEYPSLLDLPRPKLKAYRPETSIGEKLHAMATLGSKNSRMRDFYDIRALARAEAFDGEGLGRAIQMTFDRRKTEIPMTTLALTLDFAELEGKRCQWDSFLRKNGLPPEQFGAVIEEVAAFLLPVLSSVAAGSSPNSVWPPGGPWQ
jgi:predicted nucleotidyltransferase component of viral defense system